MSSKLPSVSIIMPCRNERRYVADCLESVLSNDYPSDRIEVLVVDGMSDDGTREVLSVYAQRCERIHLLDNPARTAPAALNVGVRAANGDIIIRMDAHCHYPRNYVSALVGWLERSRADNVGGVWRTLPGSDTATAQAIAFVLSHRLGVGNAHFRIGIDKPKWVDTVPFGCYRRSVFDRIGLFDEELIRNQDDEFNQRLLKAGGRILLVPDVVIDYFARDSLGKVGRMYYQYGYFKPLATRKIGTVGTARQAVPGAFIMFLIVSLVLSSSISWMRLAFAVGVAGYLAVILLGSIAALVSNGPKVGLLAAVTFPMVHFSYGFGSLRGVLDFGLRHLPGPENAHRVPISR